MGSAIIEDIRVFNQKTFRDPLGTIIEIDSISTHRFSKQPKEKGKFSPSLYDGNEAEYVKIWDLSTKNR